MKKTAVSILVFLAACGVGIVLLSPFFEGRSIELGTMRGPKSPEPPAHATLVDRDGKEVGSLDFLDPLPFEMMPGLIPWDDGLEYGITEGPYRGQRRATYRQLGPPPFDPYRPGPVPPRRVP